MNDIKKSAVGAATPATETEKENFYTDIIPSDGEKIKMLSVEYLEHHPDNPPMYNLLHLWGFRFTEDKEEEFEALFDGTSKLYVGGTENG